MDRRHFLTAAAAGATFATLAPHTALARRRDRNWELLGVREVNYALDRDVIPVGVAEGDFRKIQLRVRGNGIHFLDLKVIYGNGAPDDIPVRNEIPAGGQTRVIDLRGGDRFIKQVEFLYQSRLNFQGKAIVELWGRD